MLGYDWLLIDGEYVLNIIQDFYYQLQVIVFYVSQLVICLVEGNCSLIKQVLDIGVRILLVLMVDIVEQVWEVVLVICYFFIGSCGVGVGVVRVVCWGRVENYMVEVNDEFCLLIQVES